MKKKYLNISELSVLLGLVNKLGKPANHIIRFWEKEFKQIKPKIFTGNRRYYDENSINVLKKIKFLLKDQGMTLNGVKKVLNSNDSDIDELYNTSIKQKKIIKSKILKIKELINKFKD